MANEKIFDDDLPKGNNKKPIDLEPHPSEIYKHTDETKMGNQQYPTEIIDLPSKGLCYPKDNPLSLGTVEMRYMESTEEDILTTENLVRKGLAVDKILKSLIVTKINYDDLLLGDKYALLIAARVMGYGKEYPLEIKCPNPACGETTNIIIDLTSFNDKKIDETLLNRENEYSFELPKSKVVITFKLLTIADDKLIEQELRGLKKIRDVGKKNIKNNDDNDVDPELSTRMKYIITSVNGSRDSKTIRNFADHMLALDARDFRKHLNSMTPTVDSKYIFECAYCEYTKERKMQITPEFFWPDSEL
jgi:hypothetical protein